MNQFASGAKRNFYGKAGVTVYRLHRDGNAPPGESAYFGASVKMLLYGDAFWPTYTTGDNTGLIATDSMKNFIQRETLNFPGSDLESYCLFLAQKFLTTYPQAQGAQISAAEIPYRLVEGSQISFVPVGPDRATAVVELQREGSELQLIEVRSGVQGCKLLRLGGSAFFGFVRDQYTTLPDVHNRPLHMWLDLDWTYVTPDGAFSKGAVTSQVRDIVQEEFDAFESGSIQQIIYQIGMRMLADVPAIAEVRLEANNRTWDTIVEQGEAMGIYTDARPPYGVLGLTLKR